MPGFIGIATAWIMFGLLTVGTDIHHALNAGAAVVSGILVAEVFLPLLDGYIRKNTKHPSWLIRNEAWLRSPQGQNWIETTEEGKVWVDMLESAKKDKGVIWVHR